MALSSISDPRPTPLQRSTLIGSELGFGQKYPHQCPIMARIRIITTHSLNSHSHVRTNHHGFSGITPQKDYHHSHHALPLAPVRTSLLQGRQQQQPHREDSSSQPRRNSLQDHALRSETRHSNRRSVQRRR